MKSRIVLALLLAGACPVLADGQKADCKAPAKSLGQAVTSVKSEPAKVIELVDKAVKSSPACSCELIRSAIGAAKALPATVAQMVDAAILAAPEKKELIVMCALAAAPDAQDQILMIAEKHGLNPNPLDFPGMVTNPLLLLAPNTTLFVSPTGVTVVDTP